jgi:hypothetical protein
MTLSEVFATEVAGDVVGADPELVTKIYSNRPVEESEISIDPLTILMIIQVILAALRIINECNNTSVYELLDRTKSPRLFERVLVRSALTRACKVEEVTLPPEISIKSISSSMFNIASRYPDSKLLAIRAENA